MPAFIGVHRRLNFLLLRRRGKKESQPPMNADKNVLMKVRNVSLDAPSSSSIRSARNFRHRGVARPPPETRPERYVNLADTRRFPPPTVEGATEG
jgi:hypothetical protein